jgi:hypothetical protein
MKSKEIDSRYSTINISTDQQLKCLILKSGEKI